MNKNTDGNNINTVPALQESRNLSLFPRVILPVVIMAFIFLQSAFPSAVSDKESGVFVNFFASFGFGSERIITFIVRKSAHFAEYLALGASLQYAIKKRILIIWLIGTAYAMSDEIHQLFVPGRSCEVLDVIIDSLGVFCGIMLYRLIKKHRS